jgi:hypothetical protein
MVNENWQNGGIANIFVVRKHKNENRTIGIYLVDIFALGTKDTLFKFNLSSLDYAELLTNIRNQDYIEIPYDLAHNIIYGANEFAEEHGFKIHNDFKITQFILEEDNDNIPMIELEFGKDGEPFVIHSLSN